MTTVNYLTQKQMERRTGMRNALGYADPKRDQILLRKGMPKSVEMKVRAHEAEHISRGEEGPFLPALIGGALIQGLSGYLGGREEAKAAEQAANVSNAQYRQTRADLAPYRNVGSQAINALGGIYGYAPYDPNQNINDSPFNRQEFDALAPVWGQVRGAENFNDINWAAHGGMPNISDESKQFLANNWGAIRPAKNFADINWLASTGYVPSPQEATQNAGPDYSAFYQSPDYQFRRNEGMRDITNSFSARGGALSGNALKALAEYNSNLASGEFGNYFNRQLGLAGVGQNAANTTAQAGANTASNVGNALLARGSARASGVRALGQAGAGAWSDYVYGKERGWI